MKIVRSSNAKISNITAKKGRYHEVILEFNPPYKEGNGKTPDFSSPLGKCQLIGSLYAIGVLDTPIDCWDRSNMTVCERLFEENKDKLFNNIQVPLDRYVNLFDYQLGPYTADNLLGQDIQQGFSSALQNKGYFGINSLNPPDMYLFRFLCDIVQDQKVDLKITYDKDLRYGVGKVAFEFSIADFNFELVTEGTLGSLYNHIGVNKLIDSWGLIDLLKSLGYKRGDDISGYPINILRLHSKGYNSRQSNSILPSADTKIVDLYVAKANNDNYLDILKEIAKELGEHFDVRKEFDTPNEFRAWAEKNDKISDRMYIIIDYVLGGVTGMKKGERKINSNKNMKITRKINSEDNTLIQKVLKEDGSLYHLPNYSSRFRIKFDHGKGSGKWLKAAIIRDYDDWVLEFDKGRNPLEVEKSMGKYIDDSNNQYDRSNEMSNNAFYSIKDIETGEVIAVSAYGEETYSFNSRQVNSDVICAEVWKSGPGLKSVEDYYILSESEAESRNEELSEYISKEDEMDFLKFYTFPLTENGYSQLFDLLKSTGNAYPGMTVESVKKIIESRRPHSLNSRQPNNRIASVDIDLNKGITIGDMHVCKVGNKYVIEVTNPSGGRPMEKLTSDNADYVIKTIISRVSNWVS